MAKTNDESYTFRDFGRDREAHEREIRGASDTVVEAARAWYASAGNAEANLAAAMQRLLLLERSTALVDAEEGVT